MKRLIVLFVSALLSVSAFAQSQDKISVGYVHKKVTVHEKQKKKLAKFDAERGLTHIVEFHPKLYIYSANSISLSYIAGWRFNNWFLAGVGTGLDFATEVAQGVLGKVKHNIGNEGVIAGSYFHEDFWGYDGQMNKVSVPLYAHAKFYYMRTRWTPYSSLSLGARLAPKDCGLYFDFSAGVNYMPPAEFTEKYKISGFFFALGFTSQQMRDEYSIYVYDYSYTNCGLSHCQYNQNKQEHTHYNIIGEKRHAPGISLRLGVSF